MSGDMPRRARLSVAGLPHHVIQRGRNRALCFLTDADCRFYLNCLKEGSACYRCAVHAYVLMANHLHLLVSPADSNALSKMMRYVGDRYAHYVNVMYQRTGTLWEGRFRPSPIDSESYLLTCYRYIELNPVRSGMATNPADYPWSSYGHHAFGDEDPVIQDHPLYFQLGETQKERELAYRGLLRCPIGEQALKEIRISANGGHIFGRDRFKNEIEQAAARKVRPSKGGRPRKMRGAGART